MVATKPLEPRAARSEVEIEVPVERVWRALTDPVELARWLPLEADVHPGDSGVLLFRWGTDRCDPLRVSVWDPPHHLALTPETTADGPELLTSLRLRGGRGRTHLRVETTGFPRESAWDDLVFSSGLAYRFLMYQLRYYLERHPGEDRRVLAIHERVDCGRVTAWERLKESELLGVGIRKILDTCDGWQVTAMTSEPEGLLRLAVDPVRGEPDTHDVSLWLSAWAADSNSIDAVESLARKAIDRHFSGTSAGAVVTHGARVVQPPEPFLAYNIPPVPR